MFHVKHRLMCKTINNYIIINLKIKLLIISDVYKNVSRETLWIVYNLLSNYVFYKLFPGK